MSNSLVVEFSVGNVVEIVVTVFPRGYHEGPPQLRGGRSFERTAYV
ncbi:MAG: hypothetical protein QW096_09035 [Thermofilaceae archaeon]